MAVLILSSCSNNLDFDKDLTLSPELVLPIATLNMSLEDWAGEDIEADSSGVLKVVYSDTSMIDPIVIADYIDIPDGEGYDSAYFPLFNPEVAGFLINANTTLNQVSTNFPPADRAALVAADGTNAAFPAIVASSGGSGYTLTTPPNFLNADATSVTYKLTLSNSWPVDLDNVIVNLKSGGSVVANFTFTLVPAGGNVTEILTVPSVMTSAFEIDIVSISTPGSLSPVAIDLNDQLGWLLETEDVFVFSGNGDVIPQTLLDSTAEVDFEFSNGEEIEILELFSGNLDYDLVSSMERPTEVVVQFIGGTDVNGDPLEAVIPVLPNQANTGSIDLSGATLRLDEDANQSYNRLSLGFQFRIASSDGSMVFIDTAQTVEGDLIFNDLDFEYIEGYFGTIQEDLTGTSVELDIDFLNDFGGDFQFNTPVIKLLTTNGVGAPIRTNFDMLGRNEDGTEVALNMPASEIAYPGLGQEGQNVEGEIVIDNTNSDVVDFWANVPSTIDINGTVDINPDGNTDPNFVFRESLLKVGLEVDVNLNISASNLALTDTIEASFELEDESVDPETVTLFLNVDNGIGLDAVVTLVMQDENGAGLDSVQTQFLQAAPTDANGYATGITFVENVVELDKGQTDAFFDATQILVRTSLSTPNNGNDNYVMRTTDGLTMYLAIQSKVNVLINGN